MTNRRLLGRARHLTTAIVVAVGLGLGMAGPASAVSDDYHPTPVSRDFSTSVGGWTAQTTRTGLVCVTGLTCPEVTSAYVATGGAAGNADGFIRTTTGAVGSAVNVTDATWTSRTSSTTAPAGRCPTR